ncbi:MAG: NAD(P)H-dependent oxidoreductase [Oscillospiraceae bacterium]|nr:NAD(P)H-dependent oxidoreductase [Oscillospiraceae bacterium]
MGKTLVAYFSASGNTAKIAEKLASELSADIFEIKAKEPYTKADLTWTNPLARCNREWLGKKEVAAEGAVENMDEYDTVFLGFPIWYNVMPNVVSSFVKDYDWSGKKVALFATSGGSGVSKAADRMRQLLKGSPNIVDAKLFPASVDEESIRAWAEGI